MRIFMKIIQILLLTVCFISYSCAGSEKKVSDAEQDVLPETEASAEISEDASSDADQETAEAKKKLLTIFHTNDLHSRITGMGPELDYSPSSADDDDVKGGIARIAAVIKEAQQNKKEGETVIALDAGDFTMGTLFSALAPVSGTELHLLDRMGFLATTPGNHEFDWNPQTTAQFVNAGLKNTENINIVSSNLIFSDTDTKDDDLKSLFDNGTVKKYLVKTLDNGIKIGIFGLLGSDAFKVVPQASPVQIEKAKIVAQAMVKKLREDEKVDIVIALSHSGVKEPPMKGEDQELASDVAGIDIIISGHTHTALKEPEQIGNTIIVQAGSSGMYLGKLEIELDQDMKVILKGYNLIEINDKIKGDQETTTLVNDYINEINQNVLKESGYEFMEIIGETSFDLVAQELAESNIGDFTADAIRYAAQDYVPAKFVDVAIESNGGIRANLLKGKTGKLTVSDLFNVLPLGSGADKKAGYPLISFWLYAYEIKNGLEVITTVAPLFSDDYFLQISGVKMTYDPKAPGFNMVTKVQFGDEDSGYSDPIDISENNKKLFCIVTNYYIGLMLSVVKDYTGGILKIEPKDKDGKIIQNLASAFIDIDPAKEGVQELKLWETVLRIFDKFKDTDNDKIPEIPEKYKKPLGRIQAQ
jgi:5'-nucleotidase